MHFYSLLLTTFPLLVISIPMIANHESIPNRPIQLHRGALHPLHLRDRDAIKVDSPFTNTTVNNTPNGDKFKFINNANVSNTATGERSNYTTGPNFFGDKNNLNSTESNAEGHTRNHGTGRINVLWAKLKFRLKALFIKLNAVGNGLVDFATKDSERE